MFRAKLIIFLLLLASFVLQSSCTEGAEVVTSTPPAPIPTPISQDEKVAKAEAEFQAILNNDDETRGKIRKLVFDAASKESSVKGISLNYIGESIFLADIDTEKGLLTFHVQSFFSPTGEQYWKVEKKTFTPQERQALMSLITIQHRLRDVDYFQRTEE